MDDQLKLRLFLGKPIEFNGIPFYSPKVDLLSNLNTNLYATYILFATFDKENIMKNLYKLSEEKLEELDEVDDYELLTAENYVINFICESLEFFSGQKFVFNHENQSFVAVLEDGASRAIINKDNYKEVSEVIRYINGLLDQQKEKKVKYKNKKAKELAKEMEKMRSKYKKGDNDSLSLKDMLSILCADGGNGITVFNAHELTIYQVSEQFERLGIKNNRETLIPVWANGKLKEGVSLPELFAKTKY